MDYQLIYGFLHHFSSKSDNRTYVESCQYERRIITFVSRFFPLMTYLSKFFLIGKVIIHFSTPSLDIALIHARSDKP
jgi:hypothetical protein